MQILDWKFPFAWLTKCHACNRYKKDFTQTFWVQDGTFTHDDGPKSIYWPKYFSCNSIYLHPACHSIYERRFPRLYQSSWTIIIVLLVLRNGNCDWLIFGHINRTYMIFSHSFSQLHVMSYSGFYLFNISPQSRFSYIIGIYECKPYGSRIQPTFVERENGQPEDFYQY